MKRTAYDPVVRTWSWMWQVAEALGCPVEGHACVLYWEDLSWLLCKVVTFTCSAFFFFFFYCWTVSCWCDGWLACPVFPTAEVYSSSRLPSRIHRQLRPSSWFMVKHLSQIRPIMSVFRGLHEYGEGGLVSFVMSCGNTLQCSCLENPRDRGAWWAAVYGVTQSQTWLKWLSNM